MQALALISCNGIGFQAEKPGFTCTVCGHRDKPPYGAKAALFRGVRFSDPRRARKTLEMSDVPGVTQLRSVGRRCLFVRVVWADQAKAETTGSLLSCLSSSHMTDGSSA